MDHDTDKWEESRRIAREGHAVIFLVGLLMTVLIVVAAVVGVESAPLFETTATPSEPALLKSEENSEPG